MIDVSEDLIKSAKCGDLNAKNEIISLFKKKVENYARRYYLIGGEQNDLIQEGYLGLSMALNFFEEGKGNFAAFVLACVNNQMKNSIKKNRALKNKILNDSIPFERVDIDDATFSVDSPETLYLQKENSGSLFKIIDEELTALEKEAVVLFIKGFNYSEIAAKTGKDVKSVDNALTRARTKLSSALKYKR